MHKYKIFYSKFLNPKLAEFIKTSGESGRMLHKKKLANLAQIALKQYKPQVNFIGDADYLKK